MVWFQMGWTRDGQYLSHDLSTSEKVLLFTIDTAQHSPLHATKYARRINLMLMITTPHQPVAPEPPD